MTIHPAAPTEGRPCASLTALLTRYRRAARRLALLTLMGVATVFAVGCGEHAAPAPSTNAPLAAPVAPVLTASFKPNTGLIVPVSIAGKGYHFIVDTGASFSAIDSQLGASLTRAPSDAQVPVIFQKMLAQGFTTPNGTLTRADLPLWQSLPLQLGNHTLAASLPWLGLDLSLTSQAAGQKIDGIIGMDIVRQFTWVVDNRTGQVTVWRDRPSSEHFSHCVPYEDSFGKSPGISVEFGENWVNFRMDTGARYSIANAPLLKHLAEHKAVTTLGGATPSATVNGLAQSRDHMLTGFSFDGHALGRLHVSEGTDNFLGLNFFARLDRYMIVPSTMEFCYEASRFTQDEPVPLRNIPIRFINGHVELFGDASNELARYGLQHGDVLLDINGQRIAPAAIADAREQLATTPAGTLNLTIERAGARRDIHL
ncbi:aspartyl protease family protein [Pandoraea sputorum]|nr:aspartyl protease family protein [Pandoraea sputorum]